MMHRLGRLAIVGVALVFAVGAFAAGGTAQPKKEASPAEDAAIERYNAGLELRDEAWEIEKRLGSADGADATALTRRITERFRKAAVEFEAAVEAKPDFHQAWSSLGYAQRRLGDYEAALAAYDRALELAPDYAEAIEYRGQAYLHLGRLEAAKQAYTRLSRLAPAQAGVLLGAMEAWLADPGATEVAPADREAFSTGVRARTAAESSRAVQGW